MVVLSALAKEHRRPFPEPTFDVATVPLDDKYLKQIVHISKDLAPLVRDGIMHI